MFRTLNCRIKHEDARKNVGALLLPIIIKVVSYYGVRSDITPNI